MNVQDFQPLYDDSVTVQHMGSAVVTPITKQYCLQRPSALVLSGILKANGMDHDLFFNAPTAADRKPISGAWIFSSYVPWFRFKGPVDGVNADGVERNAGQLAIYWGMPGVHDPLGMVRQDILTAVGV